MTATTQEDLASKICEALRKVAVTAEQQRLCEMWIETGIGPIMAYVGTLHQPAELNWRTPLGKAKVEKEIDGLIRLYEGLTEKLNALHEPTHVALSAIGVGPFFEVSRCKAIVDALKKIDCSDLPANPGRGNTKNRENNIADRLAITYANITGERPTRSVGWMTSKAYGRFVDLVREVFAIAEADANPEYCARQAVERYPEGNGEKRASAPTP